MSYIVQRKQRFYVVAYNGRDPITGNERRRWHPAGTERSDADAIQQRLDAQRPPARCQRTLGGFMSTTWLSSKAVLSAPTRNRYRWMIDHNISPRIGSIRLNTLRPADLDSCYRDLIDHGGRRNQGLSAKTVLEIHRMISNALELAVDRQLIGTGDLDRGPARRVP